MKKINIILLMAGKGSRLALGYNKAFYQINHRPIYIYTLQKFLQLDNVNQIYLVINPCDLDQVKTDIEQNDYHVTILEGGKSRFESVKKALRKIGDEYDVLIHDVARPLTSLDDIKTLIATTTLVGTLFHEVSDTIKEVDVMTKTIDRQKLKAVTTPQYFHHSLISTILNNECDLTDELQLFEQHLPINYVKESTLNLKLTKEIDLPYISYMLMPKQQLIGHSYDFHPFVNNRPLILGGVNIKYEKGLMGHSDADSLYHSVTEALMDALSLGDLGTMFPDTDPKYLNQNSEYFVTTIMDYLNNKNLKVVNISAIIYIENPKLAPYKKQMAQNIKALTMAEYVNVKATTMEKCGLVGEEKGIGCEVICLITNKDN